MGGMKTMFDAERVAEIEGRIALLRADAPALWGKMTAAQVMEHCCRGMEMATGDNQLPRVFVGRLLGPMIKGMAVRTDNPMRKNSPTAPALVVTGEPDFEAGRERLVGLIDKFAAGGDAGCTTWPHAFFGKLTPEEWAGLMYKHLDHHLRQFGV